MRTREVWHLGDEVGPCGRLLNHIFDLSVPHIITVAPGNDCTCRHKNAVVEGKWHVGGHHFGPRRGERLLKSRRHRH